MRTFTIHYRFLLLFVLLGGWSPLTAQEPTIGLLFQNEKSSPGYTLFAPNSSRNTYLIDNCGYVINEWEGTSFPEISVYLLEDGSILKGSPGFVERISWDGELLWTFNAEQFGFNHHDIEPLPNGNVLMIITEYMSPSAAMSRGRRANLLEEEFGVDAIYEIEPDGPNRGKIVWKWSFWDHLVQDVDPDKPNFGSLSANPNRLNINYSDLGNSFDWLHCNSIDYNAEFDQIIISSRHTSELYIIDHSTTTAEAQSSTGGRYGKGGDLLWRWGNPKVYGRGTEADQKSYQQHHPTWIPDGFPDAGKITFFNNLANFDFQDQEEFSQIHVLDTEVNPDGSYSLNPDSTYGPADFTWTYTGEVLGRNFWSEIESGVVMLPNGNFLATLAVGGRFVEVTRDGEVVWVYQNPVAFEPRDQFSSLDGFYDVFRVERYPANYLAFQGRDLSRKGLLEGTNSVSENCNLVVSSLKNDPRIIERAFPNPTNSILNLELRNPERLSNVLVRSMDGKSWSAPLQLTDKFVQVSLDGLPNGIYLIQVIQEKNQAIYRVIKH